MNKEEKIIRVNLDFFIVKYKNYNVYILIKKIVKEIQFEIQITT